MSIICYSVTVARSERDDRSCRNEIKEFGQILANFMKEYEEYI